MRRRSDPVTSRQHRKIGGDLFNYTWSLLDRKRRNREEDDEMIHAAHASRYHWGRIGRPLQVSIGEWQISRVYSTLGRAEPALYHARRSLEIAKQGRLAPFYVAYAHEAMGRAGKVAGDRALAEKHHALACEAAKGVVEEEDRKLLEADLATILA